VLLAEARAYQRALGGRAVRCGPAGGWPAALALELPGNEPPAEYPCPYGNLSTLRIDAEENVVDYRELLTRAVLAGEPGSGA